MPALSDEAAPARTQQPHQTGQQSRACACVRRFFACLWPEELTLCPEFSVSVPISGKKQAVRLPRLPDILPSVNMKSQNYARKYASTRTRARPDWFPATQGSKGVGLSVSASTSTGRRPLRSLRRLGGICGWASAPGRRRWLPGPLRSQERIHGPPGRSLRRAKPELGSHVHQPLCCSGGGCGRLAWLRHRDGAGLLLCRLRRGIVVAEDRHGLAVFSSVANSTSEQYLNAIRRRFPRRADPCFLRVRRVLDTYYTPFHALLIRRSWVRVPSASLPGSRCTSYSRSVPAEWRQFQPRTG